MGSTYALDKSEPCLVYMLLVLSWGGRGERTVRHEVGNEESVPGNPACGLICIANNVKLRQR
jgi:hypothetical protein